MKKTVLKLELQDDKAKQKALRTVAVLQGIDSIVMDMKGKTLTVTGTVDPVSVVKKLRRYWPETAMLLVGPAKEPEKPTPEKKEEPPKPDTPTDGKKTTEETAGQTKGGGGDEKDPNKAAVAAAGGEEGKKKGDEKKEEGDQKSNGGDGVVNVTPPLPPLHPPPDPLLEMVKAYKAYNPQLTTYYFVPSMEENPNACVIC